MRKRIICGILGAYICLWVTILLLQGRSSKIPWYEKYPTVCHALGKTEEGDYLSNSLEAFLYNYSLGQRVFEADLQITSDGVMVLRHDWTSGLGQKEAFGWTEEEQWAVTAEEFLSAPIWGGYTPLTLEDWFGIMKAHPDIYLVTDTKYSPEVGKQFQLFVDTAVGNGYEDVLSRVIVQIYYQEMYDEVRAVYPFENMLLTLYYIGYPGGNPEEIEKIKSFMAEKEIPVLTMPSSWWTADRQKELEGSGIRVFVHTVDEVEEAKTRLSQGVDGIYTDNILPEEFAGWKKEAGEQEGGQ